MILIKL